MHGRIQLVSTITHGEYTDLACNHPLSIHRYLHTTYVVYGYSSTGIALPTVVAYPVLQGLHTYGMYVLCMDTSCYPLWVHHVTTLFVPLHHIVMYHLSSVCNLWMQPLVVLHPYIMQCMDDGHSTYACIDP